MINPNIQTLNPKQYPIIKTQNSKPYDLEERTFEFARRCRDFIRKSPKQKELIAETKELGKIFGSILEKTK